jgi:hypothetical protein
MTYLELLTEYEAATSHLKALEGEFKLYSKQPALGGIARGRVCFEGAQIRNQFGLITFGVVHQVTGMNLEELRRPHPGRVGQAGPGSALDLGKIGLADGLAQILLE